MNAAKVLAVGGGVVQLFGVFTIFLGIIETRRTFDPSRPSLAYKLFGPLIRGINRWRGRVKVVEIGAAVEAEGAVRVVGRKGFGFKGTPQENIQRLQQIAQEHEDAIASLQRALHREEDARKSGDKAGAEALRQSEQLLSKQIAEAAAGGLTKETWGAFFFLFGILLTVGSLFAPGTL